MNIVVSLLDMDSRSHMSLEEYCRPFIGSDNQWPNLPLPTQPAIEWWQKWMEETAIEQQYESLRCFLPQLWIIPHDGACKSEIYKRLVLRGETNIETENKTDLQLEDQQGFSIRLTDHPCGTFPVIEIKNQNDFINVVRCLAYRCELAKIQSSVHAQAVSGLIHWGLIRKTNNLERAKLIILHRSPYSSLPASAIPGKPTNDEWVEMSQRWRLEHELTHLATQRLVGEMRLNLFDELVADALGMLKGLKFFSTDLFRQGLGLNNDASTNPTGRVHTYLKGLNENDSKTACQYALQRANELEKLLESGIIENERLPLLRYLTKQRLDQPFLSNKR